MQYFWLFISYLLGSLPFGMLIAKGVCGVDPRGAGSGNVGATNVARLCGFKWGMATLVLDAAKGAAAVAVMEYALLAPAWLVGAAALAAVLGHLHSVFLGFRGGKAVAVTVGCFLVISPLALGIAGAVCLFAIAVSGFVSMGSLALAIMLPPSLYFTGHTPYIVPALIIMCLIFHSHRANIGRLLRGEEKSWRKKKEQLP